MEALLLSVVSCYSINCSFPVTIKCEDIQKAIVWSQLYIRNTTKSLAKYYFHHGFYCCLQFYLKVDYRMAKVILFCVCLIQNRNITIDNVTYKHIILIMIAQLVRIKEPDCCRKHHQIK